MSSIRVEDGGIGIALGLCGCAGIVRMICEAQ
jgi:hypothetical protein